MLGSGEELGIKLTYAEQPSSDGLAQAFIIGENFIGNDDICLVLGDNIFYGQGFTDLLKRSVKNIQEEQCATVFGYWFKDQERYGVAEFDKQGSVVSIKKPVIN